MSTHKVTIVMPVHNGERFIADALGSIEQQTFSNYRVFLSNNCSGDKTFEIASDYARRIPLTIVNHETKKTMIENFEYAFAQVSSEYFLFLCYDDYLNSPDALNAAVTVLDDNPDISSVYCDLDYVNSKGVRLLRREFKRSGRCSGEALGRASIKAARNMFGIPLLARTSALKQYKIDSRFTYVGDVDFSWQIAKLGPVYHIPKPLFANRFGEHNSTWPVLSQAATQFSLLAAKHGITLSFSERFKLVVKGWSLTQQKRIFGLYAQYRSKLG